eukprot:CAMPEP_0167818258 /NCGR_PEP_ID=MMETSP0112_2-20121227/4695_1 /TAXON_ID=91324 /ORGANISM="Lotharella globosa, Strain CCCM811" /LENGTH=133 /DNA_ID=CAMNT_0007718203 /DNA_START=27 /DNA_END=425 /DNA_ORIENTATION=-
MPRLQQDAQNTPDPPTEQHPHATSDSKPHSCSPTHRLSSYTPFGFSGNDGSCGILSLEGEPNAMPRLQQDAQNTPDPPTEQHPHATSDSKPHSCSPTHRLSSYTPFGFSGNDGSCGILSLEGEPNTKRRDDSW